MRESEAYTQNKNKQEDEGIKALYATGLVPEGFVFKTNATPADKASPTHTHTTESLVADYQTSGYDIVVLKGVSFDTNGKNYGHDAILVKKKA